VVSRGWRWVRRLCITLCRGLLLNLIIDWIRVTENSLGAPSLCSVSPASCCVQSRSTSHPSWFLFTACIGHDRILLCLHLRHLFTFMVPTQLRSIGHLLGGPIRAFWMAWVVMTHPPFIVCLILVLDMCPCVVTRVKNLYKTYICNDNCHYNMKNLCSKISP
jgi:hypothetical protein